jgi:hypothetical protein
LIGVAQALWSIPFRNYDDCRTIVRLYTGSGVKPGGSWIHGMWKNTEYALADKGRKYQVFGLDVFYCM